MQNPPSETKIPSWELGEENPNPQRPKTLPFRHVSSLFCDIFELLLQELYAVRCLHLELEENQEFLSKIIETEVFGKRRHVFEEQNLPLCFFFFNLYFNARKQLRYHSLYFCGENLVPSLTARVRVASR